MGLDRSTTQRLAASLVQGGLLDQDPTTSKYRLGLGLIELAGTMLQSHALPQVVLPYLRHVADLVGESTYLGVLDGSSVLEAVYVPTAQLIDFGGWTGRRMPLYCTASGKVLLAYMAPQRQQQVLAALDLHPFTPHTITDVTTLQEELVEIRGCGYAIDSGEYLDGVRAVAVPLCLSDGTATAAITAVGTKSQLTKAKILECSEDFRAVGREVSGRFGQSLTAWAARQPYRPGHNSDGADGHNQPGQAAPVAVQAMSVSIAGWQQSGDGGLGT